MKLSTTLCLALAVALCYLVTVESSPVQIGDILQANNLTDRTVLKIGQKIIVPMLHLKPTNTTAAKPTASAASPPGRWKNWSCMSR